MPRTNREQSGGGLGGRPRLSNVVMTPPSSQGGTGTKEGKTQIEKSEHVVKLALGGNVVITIAKFMAYLHSGSR